LGVRPVDGSGVELEADVDVVGVEET
jgi:hypothetical protein